VDQVKEGAIQYQWSDAWLLYSIVLAGGGKPAELHKIFWVADWMNRAIFTEEQFEGGLSRLSKGGWLKEVSGRFAPTRKYQRVKSKITGSALAKCDKLSKILGVKPRDFAGMAPEHSRYPGFSAKVFREAYRRYRKEFKEVYVKLHKKK